MQEPNETDLSHDPLLALQGSGSELWSEEHADEYIARLRRDYNEQPHPVIPSEARNPS